MSTVNDNGNEVLRKSAFPNSPTDYAIKVCNSDGTAIGFSALVPDKGSYDYISNAPTSTTDVYTYRSGGVSGSVIGVVTVTYTDSTKDVISSVERTS